MFIRPNEFEALPGSAVTRRSARSPYPLIVGAILLLSLMPITLSWCALLLAYGATCALVRVLIGTTRAFVGASVYLGDLTVG